MPAELVIATPGSPEGEEVSFDLRAIPALAFETRPVKSIDYAQRAQVTFTTPPEQFAQENPGLVEIQRVLR